MGPVFLLKQLNFSSNYIMFCHIREVASLRITIKTHLTLGTSAFFLSITTQCVCVCVIVIVIVCVCVCVCHRWPALGGSRHSSRVEQALTDF